MKLTKKLRHFVKNLVSRRNLLSYELYGRKPWSRGYFEYKWKLIKRALNDDAIAAAFNNTHSLPDNYGYGVDERVVEYPWVIANLPDGSASMLDAGSAFNFETILTHPKLKNKKITIVNLNPEANCFWRRGVSYLFEDIRKLPFADNSFDIIVCISTLEHIGMDNTEIYTADSRYKENKVEDYLIAATELKRVLKPGGNLFITVPFGKYQNLGFFQQFNSGMLDKVVKIFQGQAGVYFYKYLSSGWQLSSQEDCNTAEYIGKKGKDSSVAGAIAVACINLIKLEPTRLSHEAQKY